MKDAQQGATAVEMALVLPILTLVLLGTVDLARWAQAAQALDEAARAGARLAAVCDPGDAAVGELVQRRLRPLLGAGAAASLPTVTVAYEPTGCGADTCTRVRVALSGAVLAPQAPWWPVALTLPPARVEIPREGLRSTLDGRSNPSCL